MWCCFQPWHCQALLLCSVIKCLGFHFGSRQSQSAAALAVSLCSAELAERQIYLKGIFTLQLISCSRWLNGAAARSAATASLMDPSRPSSAGDVGQAKAAASGAQQQQQQQQVGAGSTAYQTLRAHGTCRRNRTIVSYPGWQPHASCNTLPLHGPLAGP